MSVRLWHRMSIKSCPQTRKHGVSLVVSVMFPWGLFWCVCVVSNQCCRRDQAALGRPGRLHTGMARLPPSVCFPPSPATASYASETSHFGSSSPTLHHTPLQNTHKHVDLFAWDVLHPLSPNYTTQLCKFVYFLTLSKQDWHSAFQRQFCLNSPHEISSQYQSKRVPYTVMPGNLTFTIT